MSTQVFKAGFVLVLLTVCIPAIAGTGYIMATPTPSPYKDMVDVPGGLASRANMPKIELPPDCDPTRKDTQNNPCFSSTSKTSQKPNALWVSPARNVP